MARRSGRQNDAAFRLVGWLGRSRFIAMKHCCMAAFERSSYRIAMHWLEGLRVGPDPRSQELWQAYLVRLLSLLNSRSSKPMPIAGSIISCVQGGALWRSPRDVSDPLNLWPLTVLSTAHFVIRSQLSTHNRRSNQLRDISPEELRDCIGFEPTPRFSMEIQYQLERSVRSLGDARLRTLAVRNLRCETNVEIALALGCSVRSVIRLTKQVRQEWLEASIIL